MTNENVIIAWTKGQAAKSLNMSTDGNDLFSYKLKIGTGGGSVIYNHTAGGGSSSRSAGKSDEVGWEGAGQAMVHPSHVQVAGTAYKTSIWNY